MICAVVLPDSFMAAQSTFLVAFHAMKPWQLPLRLISFMQLEVLPEGWFCRAEMVSLILIIMHYNINIIIIIN